MASHKVYSEMRIKKRVAGDAVAVDGLVMVDDDISCGEGTDRKRKERAGTEREKKKGKFNLIH